MSGQKHWNSSLICKMLVAVVIACLLNVASAHPIVRREVLDELVNQQNEHLPHSNTVDSVHEDSETSSPGPQVTERPLNPDIKELVFENLTQTQTQSSSESDSSPQSESDSSPENTSENKSSPEDMLDNTATEEPDTSEETTEIPDTSEEDSSESEETTSEDTTSEEMQTDSTPKPLEFQLSELGDGDTRDDSHGSEETRRKNLVPLFSMYRGRQLVMGDILGEAVTDATNTGPVTEVLTGAVGAGVTGSVPDSFTVGAVASDVGVGATETNVAKSDSAASVSVESEEADGTLALQATSCSETMDNGDCVEDRLTNGIGDDESDLHHGELRMEEQHTLLNI